ncbi:sulfatase-like hydrolase/transferase [Paenibacillus sp. GXUN7292]|uniref:sulfatase-like hydrolase/transferase n=1 Tax=Paenibacillus sp. GXUN7292 TaxID=3422499 RepID=UPI003D7C7BFD
MNQLGSKRPNIVFILSDDQGAWAMGCAGNKEIITPNLDQLAATGMRCDNFFCVSPVCSPARASLMTGRIPSQHGVHDWIKEPEGERNTIRYLEQETTYAALLAEQGYICGLSGKWHIDDNAIPADGFTHWFAHQSGGGPYYGAPMIRDGQLYREERYITDVITDDALAFLDRYGPNADQQPFYISVHYTAPHSPWVNNHPERFTAMYQDCSFESCPQEEEHPWKIPNPPWGDDVRANLQGYYASITAMDEQIGRLLNKLEQLGIRDNTLVCFMSDNGFSCGQHGFWGKGNGTYPQNMYDSSVKVPAIFSLPGVIKANEVTDVMLSGYDVMPTLLECASVERSEVKGMPGKSFYKLLKGEGMPEREHIVIFDEYGPVRMVRSKEWKYVHRYPYGPHELYHLTVDPQERVNLDKDEKYRDIKLQMRNSLEQWFYTYVDPAVDGVREPVTGAGQIGLAGLKSKGNQAFD